MKIGVIGLGGIAEKAYLPTYRKMQKEAQFLFATRNQERAEELSAILGIEHIYHDLAELIEQGIEACMIHTATDSHYQLVKTCLEAGIAVYVDKPLSEDYAQVTELMALAKSQQLLLMIGFNRRYAPFVTELAQLPEKPMMILQKNRVNTVAGPQFKIYDLFIHVVDTAVFLMDGNVVASHGELVQTNGALQRCTLQLSNQTQTVICSMDLQSGANWENYQVDTPEGTYLLQDLTEMTKLTATGSSKATLGDWETTLAKRGFEQSVATFVTALANNETEVPSQKGVVLSHKLCAEMLEG